MTLINLFSILKGGAGSGNIGHSGRPGHQGGSAPKGLGSFATTPTLKSLFEGETESYNQEETLTKVLNELNYTSKPEVVNDLNNEINKGDTALFRGVYGTSIGQVRHHVDEFKQGKMFISSASAYGNGIYTSPKRSDVKRYTSNQYGDQGIIKMALSKDARIITEKELSRILSNIPEKDNALYRAMEKDNSLLAASMGYDAINVTEKGYMVLLNRGKVKVEL